VDRLLLKTMADESSKAQKFGGRVASSRRRVPTWSTTNRHEYRNNHRLHECHGFDIRTSSLLRHSAFARLQRYAQHCGHGIRHLCSSVLGYDALGAHVRLNGRISARHFSKKFLTQRSRFLVKACSPYDVRAPVHATDCFRNSPNVTSVPQ
jgi:hypothetical protein